MWQRRTRFVDDLPFHCRNGNIQITRAMPRLRNCPFLFGKKRRKKGERKTTDGAVRNASFEFLFAPAIGETQRNFYTRNEETSVSVIVKHRSFCVYVPFEQIVSNGHVTERVGNPELA
ncbi:hypothetical protein K0M31_015599 [Melipona bicolor]|uniref:Uncharacterized protein n=1 Tax=Melipona bicolor TaxID=60889 RepID=A0AA40KF06_9HYME|nr:hypothetical protein K0M31_015599 [Melipona bicolor]